jgi:hypothetical protein
VITNLATADTDGDDMTDAWEIAHGLQPWTYDAFEDADGDGFFNRTEFLFGSDPQDDESYPMPPSPSGFSGGGGGGETNTFSYTNLPGLKLVGPQIAGTNLLFSYVEGATNLAYDIYTSTNLGTNKVWRWLAQFPMGITNKTVGWTNPPVAFFRMAHDADFDGDGMSDTWEVANGFDPNNPADATGDPDGDGSSNLEEFILGLNPQINDTAQAGLRRNYQYDAAGRLMEVSGAMTENITLDSEGNVQQLP